MKKLLLTCALLLLFVPSALAAGKLSYRIAQDDTAIVTGYYGDESELIIPSVFRGRAVTAVDEYAFADKTSLVRVTIPSTVTYIAENAFDGCTALEEVIYDGWADLGWEEYPPYCGLRAEYGYAETENAYAAPSFAEEEEFYVTVTGYCANDNSVGMDWYFLASVNGTDIDDNNRFLLHEGETVTVDVAAVEDEKKPDYGYGWFEHVLTAEDLAQGFFQTVTVMVEEDAGRFAGNRCTVDVTVSFVPVR